MRHLLTITNTSSVGLKSAEETRYIGGHSCFRTTCNRLDSVKSTVTWSALFIDRRLKCSCVFLSATAALRIFVAAATAVFCWFNDLAIRTFLQAYIALISLDARKLAFVRLMVLVVPERIEYRPPIYWLVFRARHG